MDSSQMMYLEMPILHELSRMISTEVIAGLVIVEKHVEMPILHELSRFADC